MKTKNLLTIFLALLAAVTFLMDANAQSRKTKKKKKTITKVVEISDDERRKGIESLLLQGEYQHDGSGVLFYIGTIESVPALLKVLEDHPPGIETIEDEEGIPILKTGDEDQTLSKPPKEKPVPRKFYICTYMHALKALQKITGQKFIDYEEWKNWWEENLKNKVKTK